LVVAELLRSIKKGRAIVEQRWSRIGVLNGRAILAQATLLVGAGGGRVFGATVMANSAAELDLRADAASLAISSALAGAGSIES